MKKIILLQSIILLFAASLMASDTQSFEVNGLKVIFKKNDANNIISTGLYLKGGVTQLTMKTAGIEDFALSAATKGTEKYPKDMLNAKLEKMNTVITTSTNSDYSLIDMKCVKENFEDSWDIFADIINHPTFVKEDIELIRQRKIAAIKQKNDAPDAYLGELAMNAFFIDHSYAIDVDGTIESVSAFTRDDLQNYYKKRMHTSELLLVVVGNTDIDELKDMVEETFEDMPKGNMDYKLPEAVRFDTPSIKVVERALPTNYIMGISSAAAFGSDQGFAMSLATSILRDRLFEEVRTKRNLSYAPASGYRNGFSPYAFIYVTAVDADSTIRVIRRTVEKISSEPITDKELKDKLNVFLTRYYLGEETSASQRNLLAKYELSGIGYKAVDAILQNYKKVTPQEILEVCKNNLHNFQFVLLGKPGTLDIKSFMF